MIQPLIKTLFGDSDTATDADAMQNTFDTIVKDIKAYSTFLTQAAESYEAAEREGTQKAQEQGKVF